MPCGKRTPQKRKGIIMSNNLHAASSQWANRPADERFWTLADLYDATLRAREGSIAANVKAKDLRIESKDSDVRIIGSTGQSAHLTHYAFGQLCRTVGAPSDYLRELPARIAADALQAGLNDRAPSMTDRNLLFHKNGDLTLRAMVSEKYSRVWDSDLARHLMKLGAEGWRAPAGLKPWGSHGDTVQTRVATEADILPGQINIRPGDMIAPSGLYASDHDMFVFLVSPDRIISGANGHPLMRGCFFRNSEVGDCSLVATFFAMQTVCGNHIVWGAQDVHEIRIRHIGDRPLGRALDEFEAQLRVYADGAPEEERKIQAARDLILGQTKEEVLGAIVKYARSHGLNLVNAKRVTEALDVAETHEDWYGNPRSLWGAVSGLTQASQATGYADTRAEMDRQAGKLLEMAF
jgi:hypothetical protein